MNEMDGKSNTLVPGQSLRESKRLPFEQQPGETNKAYEAFRAYLELGPRRLLADAGAKLGKSRRMMASWSDQWKWARRVAAYNAHLGQVEREAAEGLTLAKAVDWAKRHEEVRQQAWKEAEDLIALAREFKARWRDSERLPDFGALVRALDLAFKLKQFAAGMPSEIKEINTTHTGAGGGPIRVEIEAALDKIYGKPIPGEVVEIEEIGKQKAETGESREQKAESRNESQSLLTSAATGAKE